MNALMRKDLAEASSHEYCLVGLDLNPLLFLPCGFKVINDISVHGTVGGASSWAPPTEHYYGVKHV